MNIPNDMTLRDHFAGLAMQTIIAQHIDLSGGFTQTAKFAYIIADAMLKERAKNGE